MQIKRLVIENFKSIERIELIEPNPFTVFVGPNGSGKSTIFEALEFVELRRTLSYQSAISVFGGRNNIARRQAPDQPMKFALLTESFYVNEGNFDDDELGEELHNIIDDTTANIV